MPEIEPIRNPRTMKSKSKSKSSLIVSKAPEVESVVPKPNKSHIISAMVERARIRHHEIHEKLNEELKASSEEIEKISEVELTRLIKSGEAKPSIEIDARHYNWSDGIGGVDDPRVIFTFEIRSPLTTVLLLKHKSIMNAMPGCFDEDKVKNQIKASLDTTDQTVQAILSNEENVKRIDLLLSEFKITPDHRLE